MHEIREEEEEENVSTTEGGEGRGGTGVLGKEKNQIRVKDF